jgi:RimJ/RimL family protein N-acetyltransferase
MLRLVPYDRQYLDLSWTWLNDPEVKAMTLTPDFTRAQQEAFFATLPTRTDYHIWGVEVDGGTPVGAAGIKHVKGHSGEFWCYIGERSMWGRGLGSMILEACAEQAQVIGLTELFMVAASDNQRSIGAFEKSGFVRDGEGSDEQLTRLRLSLA